MQFRDNLYKNPIKMTDPTFVEFTRLEIDKHTHNTILKNRIRLTKRIYYEQIFNKYRNDIRAT